tara:strand:+ start:141 stop:1205 length:1065 start_codon:yes stop_codon:yes gene_type:complete
MKILQVVDQLNQGGTERVAVDLAILLSKEEGIEVSFYCLLTPSVLDIELTHEDIKVDYLKRKNKYNLIKLIQLFSEFNKYDIIHLHSRQVLRYAGLLYLFPKKRNFKMIFHDHYGTIDNDKKYSNYLKFCIQQMDAYIGVSESLVNWAKDHQLQQKTYLLPNIIRKQDAFLKLKTCGDIIVIGNFRPQKNYEYLCNLISKLPNSISVDLYGNPTDKEYYDKIVALAKKLNITSRLTIISGESKVLQRIKNYKLALHCAPSETGPLVAIEYLSKGVPFFMYQTGEVAKVLKKYESNVLISNFEISNWVTTILNLLKDQQLKEKMVRINHEIFNTHFSEKAYIEKCLKMYDDILNS